MAGRPNDKMFKTMVEKHGSEEAVREWYRGIDRLGGLATDRPKGFASNLKDSKGMTGRDRASVYGAVGGRKSRRGKAKTNDR